MYYNNVHKFTVYVSVHKVKWNVLIIIRGIRKECSSQPRLWCCYFYHFFTNWIRNVMHASMKKHLISFYNFFGFATEKFKRRFLISNVSAGNRTPCREQHVACGLWVEGARRIVLVSGSCFQHWTCLCVAYEFQTRSFCIGTSGSTS